MKIPTTIRFVVIAVLATVGWLGMLTRFSDTSWLLICIASLLYPDTAPDLSDSGMRGWLRGVGIRLVIVLFIFGCIYLTHRKMMQTIAEPWFILPVWLVSLWLLYRDWRKQRASGRLARL